MNAKDQRDKVSSDYKQRRPVSLISPRPDQKLPSCVIGNDTWSAEANEWDVFCAIPYPTVSSELCGLKLLHLHLHCIELSAESMSGT
ncbi:hypothetical protein TNCV_2469371 [Trichonephila clavipes]|nr:hypothetical protein TNCV_2469371 [Trichonephila clavipes]